MVSSFVSILAFLPLALASTPFDWTDCSSANAPVKFRQLTFEPHPAHFGDLSFVNKTYEVSRDLPQDITMNVEVWRGFRLFDAIPFDLKLPCVFASTCNVRVCEAMQFSYNDCMEQRNSTKECSCPIEKGTYSYVNGPMMIPPMKYWASWFSRGIYTGRFTLTTDAGDQLACLMVTGEVV